MGQVRIAVKAKVGDINWSKDIASDLNGLINDIPTNVIHSLARIGLQVQMRKTLNLAVKKHGKDAKKVLGSLINWAPKVDRATSGKLAKELGRLSKADVAKRIAEEQAKLDALKSEFSDPEDDTSAE